MHSLPETKDFWRYCNGFTTVIGFARTLLQRTIHAGRRKLTRLALSAAPTAQKSIIFPAHVIVREEYI